MASLERQYFWGCTLSKDKPEIKWLDTNDKDSGEIDILNQLALSQACLGPKAKDVSHVVQVTTKGVNSNNITQPIIILGSGVRQVQCRLEFSASATFKLIEGQGPVHLSGSHIQVLSDDGYEDSDNEDDISIDEGISSVKQSPSKEKRQNSPANKEQRPPAKKAKLDVENGDEGSSEDEPDELIPINVKNDKAKNDKARKKPVVAEAKAKKLPISAAAKKLQPDDDIDQEDSEDDDDDDDDDDDFDMDSDDDDDNDEDDSDDDDDDDDEDDDDDDDDDDKESDEESTKKITRSIEKLKQNAKNTPGKKNQDTKTPDKTPKKSNMDASINLSKTPDLNAVKQKLLKSPNLPKKIDKFKNFMKTNMKITDEKTVKDLWTFVQTKKK